MAVSYTDYTFYTGQFLGTAIAVAAFPRLALRASEIIDQVTFNRAAAIVLAATDTATIDLIKNATCAVAEKYQTEELNGWADGIQSESIGSNSVTYRAGASAQLTPLKRMTKVAALYLGSTGLMYPGFLDAEYGRSNLDAY